MCMPQARVKVMGKDPSKKETRKEYGSHRKVWTDLVYIFFIEQQRYGPTPDENDPKSGEKLLRLFADCVDMSQEEMLSRLVKGFNDQESATHV